MAFRFFEYKRVRAVPGSKEYNQWVQKALNKAFGTKLGTDGLLGAKSKAALRDFQTTKGLPATGDVDAATDKAARAVGAGASPIAGRKTNGNPQPLAADFRARRGLSVLKRRRRWRLATWISG